jgi:hypothetical protein
VEHIQDKIVDEYGGFRDVIWNMYAGALRGAVLSPTRLRDMLRNVCEEQEK